MELRGKKLVFLGDSITEGVGTSSVEYVYWNVIGKRTGANVYGYGIGGTRIAPQRVPTTENSREDQFFASRVDEMEENADVVVIFGGTNDFGHGDAAFGQLTDRTNDTFCGAYHLLIQKIFDRYPDAKLVIMTPTHRISEDDALYNERGLRRCGPLSMYAQAIRDIAAFYGIPVVDLYASSGMQPKVKSLREKFMPDGLHPNDAGNALIADCLQNLLESL